jgi:hypothetical protein
MAPRPFQGDGGRELFLCSAAANCLFMSVLTPDHIHNVANVALLRPEEEPPESGLFTRYQVAARSRAFSDLDAADLAMVRNWRLRVRSAALAAPAPADCSVDHVLDGEHRSHGAIMLRQAGWP